MDGKLFLYIILKPCVTYIFKILLYLVFVKSSYDIHILYLSVKQAIASCTFDNTIAKFV